MVFWNRSTKACNFVPGPIRCCISAIPKDFPRPDGGGCWTNSPNCTDWNTNEMAYRRQTAVPEVTDVSDEPEHIFDLYGPDAKNPGTFAANCLLARRLAERNVRFIQLYHQGWDQHGNLPNAIKTQCRETDQAAAALITDLKQRGMLDDTLVLWGGEFGRTN